MKKLGCLVVIILVCVGIFVFVTSSRDMTDEQKVQWVGEKSHRGWNRMRKFMQDAQEGWKSVPAEGGRGQPRQ